MMLERLLDRHGPRNLMVWLDLFAEGRRAGSNLVLFARPKHLELGNPGLSAGIAAARDGAWRVTLKARKPALWTWIELDGIDARFSANFVHLLPGRPQEILVAPERPLSRDKFGKALRVRSLVDTYAAGLK